VEAHGVRDSCGLPVSHLLKSPARTFLFLSQVYAPDPAAVGQHLADAAEELVRRGHRVIVYTSLRGYDDPSASFPRNETRGGVDIRRVPFSSFGKSSIAVRLLGGFLFVFQVVLRAAFQKGIDAVVVSTSPPVGALGGVFLSAIHRAPLKYWVMDVNPDQTVALGRMAPTSLLVRAFERMNRTVLRRAEDVIVLDRFMALRMNRKVDVSKKMSVIPPWAAEEPDQVIDHDANPFRRAHGLAGKVVVMYSGNHGPSNPLTTIIDAAKRITDDSRLVLLFVGGGIGKGEVDRSASDVVRSLPYQPREQLRYSLAAADVHLVTVGDEIPGIVHPSKVYGAMAVERPILLIGPEENHVADLLEVDDIGWHVRHGDVAGAEIVLREILATKPEELRAKGRRARKVLEATGGRTAACARVCDVLGQGLPVDGR